MSQFAFFLHFYPGYTMTQIMNEYAIWFFELLDEAYRVRAKEIEENIYVASAPHMKDEHRQDLIRKLQTAQNGFEEADDYSGLERLKGELNG